MPVVELSVGGVRLKVDVPEDRLLTVKSAGEPNVPVKDVRSALSEAVEHPTEFVSIRQAVTPDDRIAIVVDDELPCLTELLDGLLNILRESGIDLSAVTMVTPPGASPDWWESLPDELADVHVEEHDPNHREKMSYLATTQAGRRIYLNRTVVDADQTIILSRRRYDPVQGHHGGPDLLFPALSDADTRKELLERNRLVDDTVDEREEIAWLLGIPFFIEIIEGEGDTITAIRAGLAETTESRRSLLEDHWRGRLAQPAQVVVATIAGSAHGFGDVARALACAARIVEPGGRIILLTDADFDIPEAGRIIKQSETADAALRQLMGQKPVGWSSGIEWVGAAHRARVHLRSGLNDDLAEDLFATPIHEESQIEELLRDTGDVVIIPDAHKMWLDLDSANGEDQS